MKKDSIVWPLMFVAIAIGVSVIWHLGAKVFG